DALGVAFLTTAFVWTVAALATWPPIAQRVRFPWIIVVTRRENWPPQQPIVLTPLEAIRGNPPPPRQHEYLGVVWREDNHWEWQPHCPNHLTELMYRPNNARRPELKPVEYHHRIVR